MKEVFELEDTELCYNIALMLDIVKHDKNTLGLIAKCGEIVARFGTPKQNYYYILNIDSANILVHMKAINDYPDENQQKIYSKKFAELMNIGYINIKSLKPQNTIYDEVIRLKTKIREDEKNASPVDKQVLNLLISEEFSKAENICEQKE